MLLPDVGINGTSPAYILQSTHDVEIHDVHMVQCGRKKHV